MDRKPVSVKSYANIAIVKYWGKADAERMIPSTSSISLTLENMYTETKLSFLPEDATGDVMYIDDELQEEKETIKASKVLDLFRTNPNQHVKIETWNNMPTAAGLSSRSFFGPLAAWDKDSGDVYQVETDLKLAMIMLVLTDQKKPVSSRDGMKLCTETSTSFPEWIKQSEQDYEDMLGYLKTNDFQAVGELTEANALRMHQTTSTANPPFSYLTDASYQAMDKVKALRASGEQCYFTMDAGPNVKVLCLEEDLDRLADHFRKDYDVIVSRTKELPDA